MTNNVDLCAGLLELATQVRSRTLQALSAVELPMLTWVPPGTSNHILWHAGTCVVGGRYPDSRANHWSK